MRTLGRGRAQLHAALCAGLLLAVHVVWQPTNCWSRDAEGIELTRTDLFSVHGWRSTDVSVLGLHLGMTREQAVANARAHGLRVADQGVGGPCRRSVCAVLRNHTWVGITLNFDARGVVTQVEVGTAPYFADPAVRAMSVTHKFKGATRELFEHYSEALRVNLLGRGRLVKTTRAPATGAVTSLLYSYPRRGVLLELLVDPHVYAMTVSLVPPRARGGKS